MKKLVGIMLFMVVVLTGCIEESDTVVVLTSSGYEPYEMVDTDGNLTGFDIELMEALAEEVGIEIEWKDVDFNGIIGSLQSGQYQIAIAGITPTAERAESVDFSAVYYNSEAGLENYFVFEDTDTINGLSDLSGLVVGVQLGTIQEELADALAEEYGFTVEARNNHTQVVEEIKNGTIDVLIVESIVADSVIDANESFDKVVVDSTLDNLTGNAIAFTKDSEYVDQFNEALVTLEENGTLDELIEKWFD